MSQKALVKGNVQCASFVGLFFGLTVFIMLLVVDTMTDANGDDITVQPFVFLLAFGVLLVPMGFLDCLSCCCLVQSPLYRARWRSCLLRAWRLEGFGNDPRLAREPPNRKRNAVYGWEHEPGLWTKRRGAQVTVSDIGTRSALGRFASSKGKSTKSSQPSVQTPQFEHFEMSGSQKIVGSEGSAKSSFSAGPMI